MKQNKGVIGLGLIVAIVLGVVVVGGGAYYLGNNNGKKEVINPVVNTEVNLPDEDKNGLPDFATLPHEYGDESVVQNSTTDCTPNSTPSIKVLSPNGGETYASGQKISVKWESCNLSKDKLVYIGLTAEVNGGKSTLTLSTQTENDGVEIVTLPKTDITFGNYYKVGISHYYQTDTSYFDSSDKSFTINSAPAKMVSTANLKTYTNGEYGFSFKYPSEWIQFGDQRQIVNREGVVSNIEVQFKDSSTGSDLLVNYSIFNGLELYNYALGQFNSFSGWYAKDAEKVTVSGVDAVRANSIMNVTAKGNPINPPLKLTLVDFMDDNNIGGFNIQFRVPSTNYEKEIIKFNQLLTTFKFK